MIRRIVTILSIALILAAVLLSSGCIDPGKTDKRIIEGVGTVSYVEGDGGAYVIQMANGTRYAPVNLDDEYSVDGMAIYFRGLVLEDSGVPGIPIEIREIGTYVPPGVNATITLEKVWPGSADPYVVSENVAGDHAKASLIEFIVAGPGMEEDNWRNATITPEPILFYDRWGRPCVYHFPVESDGKTIGAFKIAARTILGCSVMYYEVTPSRFDPARSIPDAIAAAEYRYPGCTVLSALPCFSPPLTGVLVCIETVDAEGKSLLVDSTSGDIIDERECRDEESNAMDHLGTVLAGDEIEERIARWNSIDTYYRQTIASGESYGIDLSRPLSSSGFTYYSECFEGLPPAMPGPQPTISESERVPRQKALEEWQQSAEWDLSVAFDADLLDRDALAIIEEYYKGDQPNTIKARPENFWIYLNATAGEFPAYRDRLLNHPTVYVCDDKEAFFMSILQNPKAAGNNILWALDISQNPPGVTQEENFHMLLEEGFPLRTMKIVRMKTWGWDNDAREELARRINEDEHVLFVIKGYYSC